MAKKSSRTSNKLYIAKVMKTGKPTVPGTTTVRPASSNRAKLAAGVHVTFPLSKDKLEGIAVTDRANRELTCTWAFAAKYKYVDHFDVIWRYRTPSNGKWQDASKTETKSKFSVYTLPANADCALCKVKPVQKEKYKNSKGKKVKITGKLKWKAKGYSQSACATLGEKKNIPDPPTINASTLRIEGGYLLCEVENYKYSGGQVEFEVVQDGTQRIHVEKVPIKFDRASLRVPVTEGHKYCVRARGIYKGNTGNNWSDYTSDVSAAPGQVEKLNDPVVYPVTETDTTYRIELSWSKATNVDDSTNDGYEIQYTTNTDYFDISPEDVTSVDVKDEGGRVIPTRWVIIPKDAKQYFFRVRGVNNSGKGAWSNTVTASPGQPPDVPTTWSYTTSVKKGDPIVFNWTHNSLDGSKQTDAIINLKITSESGVQEVTIPDLGTAKTYQYPTVDLDDNTTIIWTVKTKGNYSSATDTGFSKPSVEREVKVYEAPTALITLGIEQNEDSFTGFPLPVRIEVGPASQQLVSLDFAILSKSSYTDTDDTGSWFHVGIDDPVYQLRVDNPESNVVEFELGPGDMNFAPDAEYKAVVTVYTSAGLTATGEHEFAIIFGDDAFDVSGVVTVDLASFTATIDPYCTDEYGMELTEGATFSVYRQNSDGTFTEIETDMPMVHSSPAFDPHPTLDYARYRVVAKSIKTGQISYQDLIPEPVNVDSIVIQWLNDWDYEEIGEDMSSAGLLVLPLNVDVSDTNNQDVELVEYIGRENPVSYYGTQKGYTSSWKCDILKTDSDNLYKIRQLARYAGDAYVREPNGTGYWANVKVQYNINHKAVSIPVSFTITKVEGGK